MKRVKNLIGGALLMASVAATSCGGAKVEVVSQDLRFCESALAYRYGMLIANFGASELNPLNHEGRGYINYYADGEMSRFIKADGNLSAPKGMLISGDKLYIADVNKVVIYDLSDLKAKAVVVPFPEGNPYVNHLVQVGSSIFASVTNTGNIFQLDIDEESMPIASSLRLYMNVPGANGLLGDGSSLYVASYPADGVTTAENLIYKVADVENPSLEKVVERPGQYDGLALVGTDLYFTDWQGGVFGCIDQTTGDITIIKEGMGGPAEIDVVGGKIAVPDLVNSLVYLFEI